MPWQLFWTLLAQALIVSLVAVVVVAMFRAALGKDQR